MSLIQFLEQFMPRRDSNVLRPKAPLMSMQPHQQRVVEEKQALDVNITKLTAFTKTPLFASLSFKERYLRREQLKHMTHYSITLDQIIQMWNEAV